MSLNILTVNPAYKGKKEIIYMPLGLGYVMSVAERAGHHLRLVDMHNLRIPMRSLEKEVISGEYDVCFMGGFAMQVSHMKEVTAMIRRYSPKTKVILGGVGGSDIPEIALNYTGADAVAIGECEAVLPRMLESIEAGTPFEDVPTFVYRSKDRIIKNPKGPIVEDLDTIPFPAFHHFDIDYISFPCISPF